MIKTKLFSLSVSTGSYDQISNAIIDNALMDRNDYVCCANVHMIIEGMKNNYFAATVNNASIVTTDGMPVSWALKLVYGINQERVSGMDLLPDLIKASQAKNIPIFFYGGSPFLLASTERFLDTYFPDLRIAGMYSPPFRDLTEEEESQVAERINLSGAKLIFVVLGCPKQEKWMGRMKGKINATMIGIGGALPVFLGIQKRAPVWMQKNGLEWLFRLYQEPRRLFWRYAKTNTVFLGILIKVILSQYLLRKRETAMSNSEAVRLKLKSSPIQSLILLISTLHFLIISLLQQYL